VRQRLAPQRVNRDDVGVKGGQSCVGVSDFVFLVLIIWARLETQRLASNSVLRDRRRQARSKNNPP